MLVVSSFLLLFLVLENIPTFQGAITKDYCQWETFEATCPPHHVVRMIRAYYGRMQSGRCVKRDYGYVTCATDVLALSDARCSGRRNCRIHIPDMLFDSVTDCPEDLRRYLSASYECLAVTSPTRESCSGSDYVKPTATSGYIASIVTEESGCGATETPWLLEALPGQRLNLTLHDYGRAPASLNDTRSSGSHCHVYAIIKERDPSRSYTVCGGGERIKHVYLSATNKVEVRIITPQARKTSRTFMIHYETSGCPDITPPHQGWTQRKDDSLVVGCNDPAKTWRLRCSNTTWIGQFGNCTTDGYFSSHVRIGSLPHASSVIVICAVAGLIGIIFVVFGLLWLRRYRRRRRRRVVAGHRAENLVNMKTGAVQQEEYVIGGQYSQAKPQPLLSSYHDAKIEENEYACVEEFPQLHASVAPQSVAPKKRFHNSYVMRHQPDMIQQYFVLDPDMMAVRSCTPEMSGARRDEILYEKHVCRVHQPRPELIQPRGEQFIQPRGETSGIPDRRTYTLPR